MKIRILGILLAVIISLSGCMKSNYQTIGNQKIQKADELKSFAFAEENVSNSNHWSSLQRAVYRDLQGKNYFYDNVNPDILVFVKELPKGVELLSGNSYKGTLETGKIKTKGQTLLIQLVDTQNYQTVWRGFAASQSNRLAFSAVQPRMVESILNQ
ncbi:DUF4136 domain-containing protein [Jiulongibacter sediminis]|uniref:DUF4136 domain-containing protein n=1 Tax=Jiulongibacter sediminis TaxID=1605367 RepID=A0A0P7C2L8_9BACT|nr:DUF4136 domain-containing protein [Jiulongibacter sediminis]KPM48322.1 hypothetical protein AFM12_06630 [Jiulongibacter sediminis]TBX24859.1 hypothetical protein TK44_06635 [Jiulongibacter sediminis]